MNTHTSTRHRTIAAAVAMTVVAFAVVAHAQMPQPRLFSVWPPGAGAGSTVEFDVTSSDDLDGLDHLVFSHPGIKAERVMRGPDKFFPKAVPDGRKFKVTVDKSVPPGAYEVRAVGMFGITNARMFVVSDRAEHLEKEPNNDLAKATPIAFNTPMNGRCDSRGFDHFAFDAEKGQRLLIRCAAQRIDSRAIVLLTLLDSDGNELRRARGARRQDPLIDFNTPAKGRYVVRVTDLTYDGGDQHVYRLTVGNAPWIDFIDPPVARAGQEQQHVIYGRNLPGGKTTDKLTINGRPLEKITVKIKAPAEPEKTAPPIATLMRVADAEADFFTHQVRNEHGVSNPVRIALTRDPLVKESEDTGEKPQAVTLPCEIVGRFHPRLDRDYYTFEAKKGQKLWIEMFSSRLGLPSDPAFVVQRVIPKKDAAPEYKDVLEVDDQSIDIDDKRYRFASSDPSRVFNVPDDGTYRVMVRDLFASTQSGPQNFYRLTIREARPDFRLVAMPVKTLSSNQNGADPWTCSVARGGAERIRLLPLRSEGFDEPIEVVVEGLPDGVSARPAIIGPWADQAYLVLEAKPDAKPWAGAIRVVGKAKAGDRELVRTARGAEIQWNTKDNNTIATSRVVSDVALAVLSDEATRRPVSAQLGEPGKVYRMARGGKLKIPAKLIKHHDKYKGTVTLKEVGINKTVQRYIKIKDVKLTHDKPEQQFEIDLDMKAPTGRFTLAMVGEVEFEYERNAAGAKAAEAEKKRLEALDKQIDDAAKKAEQEHQKAEQQAKQAADAAKKAEQAKSKAKPEQAAEAQKALDEAKKKLEAAQHRAKELADAAAQAKKEAQRAEELKKQASDRASSLTKIAKKKKGKAQVPAAVVAIEVVEYPVTLDVKPTADKTTAGRSVVLATAVKREFGFADDVRFEIRSPSGVGGVKITNAEIAKEVALAQADAAKKTQAHEQAKQEHAKAQKQLQSASAKVDALKRAADEAKKLADTKAAEVGKVAADKPDKKKAADNAAKQAAAKADEASKAHDGAAQARQAAEKALKQAEQRVNETKKSADQAARHAQEVAKKLSQPVVVPKDAGKAKLAIDTSTNTKPGRHTFTLVARYKFGNQNVEMQRPVTLTILPAEKKG